MDAVTVEQTLAALPEPRQTEARELDVIFREVTGWKPRMWRKVIGYGQFHYRYPSGREGDSFATGFNPGPREISVHILPGYEPFPEIAARLGPHRWGKSCWYFRRLDALDRDALRALIRAGLEDLDKVYPVESSGGDDV